jgi:hypothetical protein
MHLFDFSRTNANGGAMKHQIIIAGLIAVFSIGSAYADGDHNYPYSGYKQSQSSEQVSGVSRSDSRRATENTPSRPGKSYACQEGHPNLPTCPNE